MRVFALTLVLLCCIMISAPSSAASTEPQAKASDCAAVGCDGEREELRALVLQYRDRHQRWAVLTFAAYAGTLLVSGLANAIAAIVLKSDRAKTPSWSAAAFWISLLGVAAITINSTFAFGSRWSDNRKSQEAVEQLVIDLTDPKISTDAIRTKLKIIEAAHTSSKLSEKF